MLSLYKKLDMPLPRKKPAVERVWYRIGDVAKMFGVNQSLIRYYENEFDILKPRKNSKGTRNFTPKDLENLKLILFYINERGYTIEGAKAKMNGNLTESVNNMEIVESLMKVKEFLLKIKSEIDIPSKE